MRIASLLALFWANTAFAQTAGFSTDIEILRPRFSPFTVPGIDVPLNQRPGSVRWGINSWYSMNPLIWQDDDEEIGAVVKNRVAAVAGFSADITRAVTLRAVLPTYADFGSDLDFLSGDGFGLGDLSIGAHFVFVHAGVFSMGAATDVYVPSGYKNAWKGEPNLRGSADLLFHFNFGRVGLATTVGVMGRASIVTTEDWTLATELVWNTGLEIGILPEKLALGLGAYTRFGFTEFGGPAESTAEALLTLRYSPIRLITLDFGGGRGLTSGYGADDFRAYFGLTFTHLGKEKIVVASDDAHDDRGGGGLNFDVNQSNQGLTPLARPEVTINTEGDDGNWAEGELARIDQDRIEIRDEVHFRVGTSQLLPRSIPTLEAVAELLRDTRRVQHVVIEGHASTEGSFATNYRLSMERSAVIYEKLINLGVHPSRLSIRGFGEITPETGLSEEEARIASRRVKFHITQQLDDWDPEPSYPDVVLPWNGEVVSYGDPPPPPEPETPPEPAPESFDESADEIELDLEAE